MSNHPDNSQQHRHGPRGCNPNAPSFIPNAKAQAFIPGQPYGGLPQYYSQHLTNLMAYMQRQTAQMNIGTWQPTGPPAVVQQQNPVQSQPPPQAAPAPVPAEPVESWEDETPAPAAVSKPKPAPAPAPVKTEPPKKAEPAPAPKVEKPKPAKEESAYEGVWKSLFDDSDSADDCCDVDDSGDDQSDFVFISEMPRKRGRRRTLANLAKVDALLTKEDPIVNAPIRTTPATIIMLDSLGKDYDPAAAKEFFSQMKKNRSAFESKEKKITRDDSDAINEGDAWDLPVGLEVRKQAALREWAERVERKHAARIKNGDVRSDEKAPDAKSSLFL